MAGFRIFTLERSPSVFTTDNPLRIAVYGSEIKTKGRGVGLVGQALRYAFFQDGMLGSVAAPIRAFSSPRLLALARWNSQRAGVIDGVDLGRVGVQHGRD
jgi:hypothetical protein